MDRKVHEAIKLPRLGPCSEKRKWKHGKASRFSNSQQGGVLELLQAVRIDLELDALAQVVNLRFRLRGGGVSW